MKKKKKELRETEVIDAQLNSNELLLKKNQVKKYIQIKDLVIDLTGYNNNCDSKLVVNILEISELRSFIPKCDHFLRAVITLKPLREIYDWICELEKIELDTARLRLKKFLLIWGYAEIILADNDKEQLIQLQLLMTFLSDAHLYGDTISIPDTIQMLNHEEIKGYYKISND